jgi:alpha-L-fucosidase 2
MGSYQMLGELLVDMGAGQEAVAGAELYRRGLDLETAVHSVTYRADGVVHRREAFASHADGVMVFRFSSDRHSACNGRLKGAHKENKTATGNRLVFPARWITG